MENFFFKVYIAEISAARIRGTLGSVTNLAITVGLILAYVAGVFCHWRWLAFIGAIPPTLQVILMFPVPETPRWLLGKGRRSKALESLLWLRGPNADIEEECVTIRETIGELLVIQTQRNLKVIVFSDTFSSEFEFG